MKILKITLVLLFAVCCILPLLAACHETTKLNLCDGEHVAGEWVITRAPTGSVSGMRQKKCTVCNTIIEVEIIPPLSESGVCQTSHTEGGWVTVIKPSEHSEGKQELRCLYCNYPIETRTMDKLAPTDRLTTSCRIVWITEARPFPS